MRTKILIIAGGLLVIALVAAFYLLRGTPMTGTAQTGTRTSFPTAPPTGQSAGATGTTSSLSESETTAVAGADGSAITALDFLHATTTTEDAANPGLYHLDVPPSADPAASYDITYESATQYFNISLLAEPIGETRVAMEDDLMAKLGLTEDEMCRLNYMVSVPYWVNDFYTGESLGFSFCPGAVALPQ